MKIKTLLLLSSAFGTLGSLPAMADTFVTYSTPLPTYTSGTTDYGGGDGSSANISNLGPFTFSSPLQEVPDWATWNSPPAVESTISKVLYTCAAGNCVSTLTLTLTGSYNTAGFELEPANFGVQNVTASFYDGGTLIDTLSLDPNGDAGALLYALTDTSPGASITSIVITDNDAGQPFGIAQLRAGDVTAVAAATPEPSSLALLGTGLLAASGMIRRRLA